MRQLSDSQCIYALVVERIVDSALHVVYLATQTTNKLSCTLPASGVVASYTHLSRLDFRRGSFAVTALHCYLRLPQPNARCTKPPSVKK